jgi:predicted 3-demethylubiquinone-9 3-methyltransferase (glyoxalase superfamily)
MSRSITPCLWFADNAEEAMRFYMSIFPDGELIESLRNPDGTLLTATFRMNGQRFMVLNGGPEFQFNEAVSFFVDCEDQAEVDRLWSALLADGGSESQCGWLADRFGLSWQIVPRRMIELLTDPDRGRADRAMQAMLKMQKIDLAEIEAAAG